jgi:acyl-CoA synthetase (AMP-forming)/AMP-acid ligase II
MDFVKARLSDYRRVREVEFIEQVPRTASGKILRRELAERERAKAATP